MRVLPAARNRIYESSRELSREGGLPAASAIEILLISTKLYYRARYNPRHNTRHCFLPQQQQQQQQRRRRRRANQRRPF